MMLHHALEHRFVESFPDSLEPGILYVSLEYGSAAHSCCCGCGEEVVTPLTPTDWNITFDGETITLHPSVGSWSLACRSHYVIRRGKVIEAPPWTDAEVASERHRDRRAKARYFNQPLPGTGAPAPQKPQVEDGIQNAAPRKSWWVRLSEWWNSND